MQSVGYSKLGQIGQIPFKTSSCSDWLLHEQHSLGGYEGYAQKAYP